MQIDYHCADCDTAFYIKISEREIRTTISGARHERCPRCTQRVGYRAVTCGGCGEVFPARAPLRHAGNRLAFGECPHCRRAFLQPVESERGAR